MDDSVAREAFCEVLNSLKMGWRVAGSEIAGPGHARVRLDRRHPSQSDGHVDVEFVLDDGAREKIGLWDCVAGFGATAAARARSAAHLWASTTARALFELKYSGRGEFADHFHGHEPEGFAGWHVICGAIIGFGHGDSPQKLQEWWLQNPLLPALSTALAGSLDERSCPHGIKILFGGDGIAEVRLNGEAHAQASALLATLAWPRIEPAGFVRSYVVVLHRDPEPRPPGR